MPRRTESTSIHPLDGGWGWVVVACVFFIRFLSFGTLQSIGVTFDLWMEEFGCSKSDVGAVGSIALSLRYFLGPFVSLLQDKYGTRFVVFIGSAMCGLACIFSAFSPNIYFLYFAIGVIGGVGMGMIYLPVMVALTYYFEKRRTLAAAIGGIGSYFGCFVCPYFIRFLINVYGWRGAFFIIGAVTLNALPAALILKPHRVIARVAKLSRKSAEVFLPNDKPNETTTIDVNGDEADEKEEVKPPFPVRFVNYLKALFEIFKIPAYTLFVLSNFLMMLAYFMPSLFIKDWGKTLGMPMERTVILQSLVGPGNILGRPAIGYLSDRFPQQRILMFSGVLILSGLIMSVAMLFADFYFMAFFVFQYAFLVGSTQTMLTPILADILPLNQVGFAFGVLLFAEGAATLAGPPLLVLFPTYELTFSCTGLILIASGVVLVGPIYANRLCNAIPCYKKSAAEAIPVNSVQHETAI